MTHTLASVSVSQSVQNLLNTVAHSVPKIAVFLVVLVIGWLVASIVKRAVVALLQRVHFDRMADRGSIGQALSSRGYNITSMLGKLVYYAVLLITLQLAFGVFGPNPVSTMLNSMVGWLPKAIVAIVLVVIAAAIAKVVKELVGAALGGLSYGRFVASTAAIVIIALGVIAALDQIDVAASVTQPVLIAVLATAGAILAIGIGGGMVRPMEQRWERMLGAAERETSSMGAYQRGRQDALSSPGAVAGQHAAPATGQDEAVFAGHGTYAGQDTTYAGQGTGTYTSPGASTYAPDPGMRPGSYAPEGPEGAGGMRDPMTGGMPPRPPDPGMPSPYHHERPDMQ
jgi:Conserved TM helix